MKKGISSGLETLKDPIRGISFIVAIAGLVLSLPFLSYNFTGHTIADLTQSACDVIGTSLFCLGLIGALIYFKRK